MVYVICHVIQFVFSRIDTHRIYEAHHCRDTVDGHMIGSHTTPDVQHVCIKLWTTEANLSRQSYASLF